MARNIYLGAILAGAWLNGQAPAQDVLVSVEPHIRWVRLTGDDLSIQRQAKVTSVLLNRLSTNPDIVVPQLIGNMVRVDAEEYAPKPADLKRFLTAWEEFRFDPAFNVLKIVEGKVVRRTLHDPAMIARHASEAPVVDFHYFMTRSITTIKQQGGKGEIFGGLYYELSGAKATEQELTKSLGVKADDLLDRIDELSSQLRAAMIKSGVTGKPRRIDMLATTARFNGWVMLTRDVADGDQDGGSDAIASLARLKVVATEILYSRPNGMDGQFLSNGAGERQDEAPNFGDQGVVAADMMLDREGNRNPHSVRLQTCLFCHWVGESRGLIPLRNDVLTMRRRGIAIKDKFVERLYRGDPDTPGEPLQRLMQHAREDLVLSMVKATAVGRAPGWPGADPKEGTTQIVKQVGDYIKQEYRAYNYELIDARQALVDLGVQDVPEELDKSLEMFNKAVPVVEGEHLNIALIRKGFGIDRFKYSLVRGEIFERRVR